MSSSRSDYWSLATDELMRQLGTTLSGLTSEQAQDRLLRVGPNSLKPPARTAALTLLLSQFSSPIILILFFAAGLSAFLGDATDAVIILLIVLASGLLSFWQERGAADAVARLLAMVEIKAMVRRGGAEKEIPVESVVPGDIVLLNAGDTIPGDCRLLESKDLFVDQAALTGETFPVEAKPAVLPASTPLAGRTNVVYMGTHVVSGTGTAVVARTGRETEFGQVSERLKTHKPETEFEHGIRRFGFFLMQVTLFLVIAIFAINVYFQRPVLDSLLFALALAVGLTPQLLPAIISINLARGAKRMADVQVIVKRLAAIENFGSMNVLCSDKTGTLTEGTVRLHAAVDAAGNPSSKVMLFAYLNAAYESGFVNPIDQAIRSQTPPDISAFKRLDEVPYDFWRKRLSVLVAQDSRRTLITKGAVTNVLDVCAYVDDGNGECQDIAPWRERIENLFQENSRQGYRGLGVAYREMPEATAAKAADEAGMTFLGLLFFFDPPKPGIVETVRALNGLGIALKVITGDSRLVAANVAEQVGLAPTQLVTGPELHQMSSEALVQRVQTTDVFAEIEPNQKERILVALHKAGNVVGYLGDGINDGSALHAADVGISVDSAVDVAKEAADIVLLEHDLAVLIEGVQQGRVTFANTLKYVFMATSANFGNMFSMAGASLFLPFLPLLPKQILLTNLLTDFPETTIATDSVDAEMVNKPRRWDIRFIRNFMIVFGLVSSIFDYLTFGVLLFALNATVDQFRTGWFIESVISASLIVLVIRTRRPFFQSRPGKHLLRVTLAIVAVTLLLPISPLAGPLALVMPPPTFLVVLAGILALYIATAELAKRLFYARISRGY